MARTARAVTVIPSTINPLTRMAVTSVAKRRVAGYADITKVFLVVRPSTKSSVIVLFCFDGKQPFFDERNQRKGSHYWTWFWWYLLR